MTARTAFLPLAALLASAVILGCSGAPDGRTEPTLVHPAPSSSSSPADPSSPVSDPADDTACVTTVADYCSLTNCYATWSDADDACMGTSTDTLQISTSCNDAYYALAQRSTTSYYASSTQAIVAVVDASGRCVAGPSDFVPPTAVSCAFETCTRFSCGGPPDGGTGGAMP